MSSLEERARRVRGVYLSLPDTKETPTWGSPHFRVMDKIFGGFDHEGERTRIGFKLEMEHAAALVASDPRFTRAAYVGHKGWVSMDVTDVENWDEVRVLVAESYRLIAPKRSLAKLQAVAGGADQGAPSKATQTRKAARGKAKPSSRASTKTATTSRSAKKVPAKKASAARSAKKAPAKKASAARSAKKVPAKKVSAARSAKKAPPSKRGR